MGRTRTQTASEQPMTADTNQEHEDGFEERLGIEPREARVAERTQTPVQILTVLIDRDAHTKIPATIFEWELQVLEEMYGEDTVSVVEERDGVTTLTAGEAHRQMLNKYKQTEHQQVVKTLYRNAGRLAKLYGLPHTEGDNKKGGSAPPAIDFSGEGNPRLLGTTPLSLPAETRRT